MSRPIFDTSVLVDGLRGRAAALTAVAARATAGRACTHLGVAAELIAGARSKADLRVIEVFLVNFDVTLPIEADGPVAFDLYRRFFLSHGVGWADCQIAATALRLDAEVITLNVKHFAPLPGLRVTRPY